MEDCLRRLPVSLGTIEKVSGSLGVCVVYDWVAEKVVEVGRKGMVLDKSFSMGEKLKGLKD